MVKVHTHLSAMLRYNFLELVAKNNKDRSSYIGSFAKWSVAIFVKTCFEDMMSKQTAKTIVTVFGLFIAATMGWLTYKHRHDQD
ncbi:MAG: hypothetical protein HOP36_01205 [Methyloglobulus sp.]|nr:hypothetical protein [Methyloglobulus sp.]